MTPAALVPPVPCPVRGTALRRALGTLVFLGGLLVLAVAFGGQAEAAERLPAQTQVAAATATTERVAERATDTITEPVRAVAEPVVRPARAAVRATVGETLRRAAGAPVAGEVVRPVADVVPDTRDRVPAPLPTLPAPSGPLSPSASTPAVQLPAAPATSPVRAAEGVQAVEPAAPDVRELLPADGGHNTPVPAPGRPCGVPATSQASTPRGGDQQAAALAAGAPCTGLARGATLPATVAVLLDRAPEVLEFPG
ncbi:hypothetical protein [Streptomyces sp.]|uniref:hypothetical protein n=1 Tax=Streptomyces sp. TaxID=1931 RepID=UPI002F94003D